MIAKSIQRLIDEFSRLPGIGGKTAARLTFYMLGKNEIDISRLADAISSLKKDLKKCSTCFNWSEADPCGICSSENRERDKVCVVEEPMDVIAIEKTGYKGLYHVLGGVISPVEGMNPENLTIKNLLDRLSNKSHNISEIILATDPSLEGEATASYIATKLKDDSVKITRIARGLPIGGELEYADEVTLRRAMEGRRELF